jgi:DNA-binding Lrp family transcriptional regulator
MQTQKSADARSRSPRLISDINDRILTALETYQWRSTASMLYFAISLGISESYLRINIKKLEKLGLVEPFVAGKERGKSVINYRLVL